MSDINGFDVWADILKQLASGAEYVDVSDGVWPRIEIRREGESLYGVVPAHLQNAARGRGLIISHADFRNGRYRVEPIKV